MPIPPDVLGCEGRRAERVLVIFPFLGSLRRLRLRRATSWHEWMGKEGVDLTILMMTKSSPNLGRGRNLPIRAVQVGGKALGTARGLRDSFSFGIDCRAWGPKGGRCLNSTPRPTKHQSRYVKSRCVDWHRVVGSSWFIGFAGLSMFRAYKFVRLTEFSDRTLPSPASSTLSISSHPPSSQPGNSPHSRLSWLLSPSCALHTPQRDTSGRGRDTPHNIHPHDQPVPLTLEVDYPTTADASTPADLADQLQLPLPPNCRRLGQEDLKIVGTRPIDAGGFADVWVGEMDGRAVAVKSYRCYASANCTPTYKVSYPQALRVLCSPTTNR